MSTAEGHSAWHALQEMQRSITSCMRGLVSISGRQQPDIAARSALARPRVLCSSSRVTMKLGHIVPLCVCRQTPGAIAQIHSASQTP